LGGTNPTLTDAALAVGTLDPRHYLGGRKLLDVDAARRALAQAGETLGLDAVDVAHLALATASALISNAVRARLDDYGASPSEAQLFAIGGAGGLLAASVARDAGLAGAVAFPLSPVFSAFGLSRLDIQHTYEIAAGPASTVSAAVAEARARALRDMAGEGVSEDAVRFSVESEIERDGKVTVRILDDATDVSRVESADRIRLLRLRAHGVAARSAVPGHRARPRSGNRTRGIHLPGVGYVTAEVHAWDEMEAGRVVDGPAVVESDATTVLVPTGFSVKAGSLGELKFNELGSLGW
jgi:N-methylhydantoinase A/oxoprolinase/acetone carboxylase beta subunit